MTIEKQLTDLQRDITNLKDAYRDHAWRIECLESVNAAREHAACKIATQPFVMEVGRRYRCRNGLVVKITSCSGGNYPWTADNGDKYAEKGTYWFNGIEHDFDIVSYADEPRADAPEPASDEEKSLGQIARDFPMQSYIDCGSTLYRTDWEGLAAAVAAAANKANYEEAMWLLESCGTTVEPMDTVSGVLSQISNFIAGQRDELQAKDAEIERLQRHVTNNDSIVRERQQYIEELKAERDAALARAEAGPSFVMQVGRRYRCRNGKEAECKSSDGGVYEGVLYRWCMVSCNEFFTVNDIGVRFVGEANDYDIVAYADAPRAEPSHPRYASGEVPAVGDVASFNDGNRMCTFTVDSISDDWVKTFSQMPYPTKMCRLIRRADATEPRLAKNISDSASVMLPSMTELVELADSPESDAWLNDKSYAAATEPASDGEKSLALIGRDAAERAGAILNGSEKELSFFAASAQAVAAAACKAKDAEILEAKKLIDTRWEQLKERDAEIERLKLRLQAAEQSVLDGAARLAHVVADRDAALARAEAAEADMQALLDYFRDDEYGKLYGREGDTKGWSTAKCAVEIMKRTTANWLAEKKRAEAAEKEAAKFGTLQSLANEIREINKANGWNVTQPVDWSDTYKVPAILALITSEVSEALEAFRKDDALNFCEEMADTLIRVLDCIAAFDLDFDATVRAKMEKNKTRGHKHGGKRV